VLLLTQGNQDSLKDADDILNFESSFANVTESTKCAPTLANGTEDPNADELGRMTLVELQEATPAVKLYFPVAFIMQQMKIDSAVGVAVNAESHTEQVGRRAASATFRAISHFQMQGIFS
jgi:hypothetical protein